MAEKVKPSFDQYVAKKGESSDHKKLREAYEKAAAAVTKAGAGAENYAALREAKRLAAAALTTQRQKEEADYYAEEVAENVEVIKKMKAENESGKAAK